MLFVYTTRKMQKACFHTFGDRDTIIETSEAVSMIVLIDYLLHGKIV